MIKYHFLIIATSLILNFGGIFQNGLSNEIKFEKRPVKDSSDYQYGDEKLIETWKLDHFETQPGKLIGIWPLNYATDKLIEYRTLWGYKGIFLVNKKFYRNALSAGYTSDDIMISIAFNAGSMSYQDVVSSCNAHYYYIDEAVNHSCYSYGDKRLYNPEELRDVSKYIHTKSDSSLFVSSGYKRCSHFDTLVTVVDKIMYSAYADWRLSIFPCLGNEMGWGSDIEFAWLPGSDDQRYSWKDMKMRYNGKFTMTWINSYEVTEFDDLFAQAEESGLNEIWIYTLDDHHFDQFENISNAASEHGFLKKIMRKYTEIFRCISKDGCSNFQADNTNDWKFVSEKKTDILKEE